MTIGSLPQHYRVAIDADRCMSCERCIENCPYGVFRREGDVICIDSRKCTACHRCIAMCPRDAITLKERPVDYRSHPLWTRTVREDIYNQARTGKIILAGMGNALAVNQHEVRRDLEFLARRDDQRRLPERQQARNVGEWEVIFNYLNGDRS